MRAERIWKFSILIVLFASVVCFGLGLYFPIFSTHTKVIWVFGYTTANIFDSVKRFFESKDYFIAVVILLFTFVVPILNYISLFVQIILGRMFERLPDLNKWNMLDVFVVALVLMNFKMQSTSSIMIMQLQIGTIYIAIAVLLRMITVVLMHRSGIFTNKNKRI